MSRKSPTITFAALRSFKRTMAQITRDSVNDLVTKEKALSRSPRLMIYDYRQDDPRKCTSARLRKFQLVHHLRSLGQISHRSIVLNPISSRTLSHDDRKAIREHGLVGLDCSWNLSDQIFDRNIPGENRRLPLLLAGNPTSYGIAGRLSTAEALAAALFLTGFRESGEKILSLFKWGPTFLSLNREPLKKYSMARSSDLSLIEREYFSTLT
jgi:pre-rRNA-processing protein TSR3